MTLASDRARAWGHALEILAALWLRAKGYRILARNFRATGGEIDIIAVAPGRWAGQPILCFVEVRGRESVDEAVQSVLTVKQARIRRAAAQYLAQNRHWSAVPRRFDIVASARGRGLRHVRGAFDG